MGVTAILPHGHESSAADRPFRMGIVLPGETYPAILYRADMIFRKSSGD
jgi:hypothetical protein